MSAHEILKTSLHDSVAAAGQPAAVTKRLSAWIDALSEGSENTNEDLEETQKRLETVLDAIKASEEEL